MSVIGAIRINVGLNSAGVNKGLKDIKSDMLGLGGAAKKMENSISSAMSNSEKSVGSLITKVAALVATMGGIKGALNVSDDFSQTASRIDQMNDGLQTSDDLIHEIYKSAQRARGSFDGMASVVGRFGNNARDAFESAKEVIDFSELIQKQMVIAGAGTEEAKNAMVQLSQAMGSGVLRGDELNSIFLQAPNLIRTIADYMDLSIADVRAVAAEGKITADIIKKAVFAAADDINEQFEKTPKTWGQAIVGFKNTALMSFRPVLSALNNLANSTAFKRMENAVVSGLDRIAGAVTRVINAVAVIDVANELNLKDDGMKEAAAGTAKYAQALGKVTSAAKTAKGSLAGFDDLDVLNAKTDSGSGYEKTIEDATKAADAMQDLTDTVEKTGDVIEESLGKRAADVINKLFADNDFEKGASVMMTGLGLISDAVNDFSEAVRWKEIGRNFGKGVSGLFSPADWKKAGKSGGKLVNGLFNTMYQTAINLDYTRLGEALAALFTAASEQVDVSKWSGAVGRFVTGYFEMIRTALSDPGVRDELINTISEFFAGLFDGVDASVIGEALGLLFSTGMQTLRTILGSLDPSILTDGLRAFLANVDFADLATLFALRFVTVGIPSMMTILKPAFREMLMGLLNGEIMPWISGTAIPAVTSSLSGMGTAILTGIFGSVANAAIAGILAALVGVVYLFQDELKFIIGVWGDFIEHSWDYLTGFFVDAYNWLLSIVGLVKDLVTLNFDWDVNAKVATTGGQNQWMSLPHYATGAVIRGGNPYLAVVGDQPYGQTNIETPMSTMLDAFRAALDDWKPRGGGGTVILELDGRELARAELDYITEEAERRGISLA